MVTFTLNGKHFKSSEILLDQYKNYPKSMYDLNKYRMDASFSFNKFPKCDIRRGFRYPLTEEIVLFPQVDFKAFK